MSYLQVFIDICLGKASRLDAHCKATRKEDFRNTLPNIIKGMLATLSKVEPFTTMARVFVLQDSVEEFDVYFGDCSRE